jgi:hypothetical protein
VRANLNCWLTKEVAGVTIAHYKYIEICAALSINASGYCSPSGKHLWGFEFKPHPENL